MRCEITGQYPLSRLLQRLSGALRPLFPILVSSSMKGKIVVGSEPTIFDLSSPPEEL